MLAGNSTSDVDSPADGGESRSNPPPISSTRTVVVAGDEDDPAVWRGSGENGVAEAAAVAAAEDGKVSRAAADPAVATSACCRALPSASRRPVEAPVRGGADEADEVERASQQQLQL
mmetsp:Transcript_8826/g.18028  ORF Transcript_8826/g.18028 Transcript_8826/m.18028 type:complete len:117 (+) Transcript_8826:962-1312(+)